jgi:hypothetical protein
MSLKFVVDNREIEISSFNKNFDPSGRGWGSIFKIKGNDQLAEIGLTEEFYFKCNHATFGTFAIELKEEDAYRPLQYPENLQQLTLFYFLRNSVMSGEAYF